MPFILQFTFATRVVLSRTPCCSAFTYKPITSVLLWLQKSRMVQRVLGSDVDTEEVMFDNYFCPASL